MDGIYGRYIKYGEFKELVEGKDGWVRGLMMSIGLGDIRRRVKPSKNVSYRPKIYQATSCFMAAGFTSFFVPCFTQDLEDSFFTSAYQIFLHFKRIGDYELLIDYRSRISKYDSYIRNIDKFRNFIKEIDVCIRKLADTNLGYNNELMLQPPHMKPDDYPRIEDAQLSYISNSVEVSKDGAMMMLVVPKEQLYMKIYDITEAWNMSDRTSHRKWRLLFELLNRRGILHVNEGTMYKDFVNNIVSYCIGEVADSTRKRIASCILSDSYKDWSNNDKSIYTQIKKDLFA